MKTKWGEMSHSQLSRSAINEILTAASAGLLSLNRYDLSAIDKIKRQPFFIGRKEKRTIKFRRPVPYEVKSPEEYIASVEQEAIIFPISVFYPELKEEAADLLSMIEDGKITPGMRLRCEHRALLRKLDYKARHLTRLGVEVFLREYLKQEKQSE